MANADAAVEIEFHIPTNIRLKLDSARVEARVGNKIAAFIRRRIGSRVSLRSGTSLNQTGDLIRSIKYDKKAGVVRPSVRTRPGASPRARSNFGIMKIYISGKFRRDGYQRLERTDPMGSEDPKLLNKIPQWTQQAINSELKAGRASLVDELRRSLDRGRR